MTNEVQKAMEVRKLSMKLENELGFWGEHRKDGAPHRVIKVAR